MKGKAVVLAHYLSERQIGMLRDSGVPILCQVGDKGFPVSQFYTY